MTLEEFVVRLLIVAAIGFIIGVERQLTGHVAGLKPTVVIAIGSMVFVAVEIVLGNNDARMAANIITGIGFLCSGVILKNGLSVNGLNTSATLWATAAISVLVGYGYEIYGIIAASMVLVFNLLLPFASKLFKPIKFFTDVSNEDVFCLNIVCLKVDVINVKEIIMSNETDKLKIDSIQVSSITEDKFRIKAKLGSNHSRTKDVENIADKIFDSGVLSVAWEKSED